MLIVLLGILSTYLSRVGQPISTFHPLATVIGSVVSM